MSDRSSAEIYARHFKRLAKRLGPDGFVRREALEIWRDSMGYDFHPVLMGCDRELVKLGLAKPDPDEPGCFLYADENGKKFSS